MTRKLRPLHIDIHGGGWIGGFAEQGSRLNTLIAEETGAIVVSITYRIAPRYIYPAAHDDVEDVVDWLVTNAYTLGADAQLMTIGGGSVGASLGLGVCQYLHRLRGKEEEEEEKAKRDIPRPLAFVGICPALDFRQSPGKKPRPPGFPTFDPLSFLVPLFDVYAGTAREKNMCDGRLHSVLAPVECLPDDVLIVAAGIDILLYEALVFVERLKGGSSERVECMLVEKGFHGFVECEYVHEVAEQCTDMLAVPSFILKTERLKVFELAIKIIRDAHKRAGFDIDTAYEGADKTASSVSSSDRCAG